MFLLYHISYNLCPILKRNWQTGTLYSETELMAALCVTYQTSDNAWPMASYFISVCVCVCVCVCVSVRGHCSIKG